jgi:Sulfotransferase family
MITRPPARPVPPARRIRESVGREERFPAADHAILAAAASLPRARRGQEEREAGMSKLSSLVRRLRLSLETDWPRSPPRRFAVFDHVPKTGGTAINQALLRLFSPAHVAVNRHVDIAAGMLDFADRYPIVSGHFGGKWRREFQRGRNRLTFTLIRDPIKRAISTYSFWRHRVREGSANFNKPTVQAAKSRSFGDFIRSEEPVIKISLFNTHFVLLAGRDRFEPASEPENQARYRDLIVGLVDEFDVIGVTERLPDTLGCFLAAVGHRAPRKARALLTQVERNASPALDPREITSADRAFLAERNALDFELHAAAEARLEALLRAQAERFADRFWRRG